MPTDTTKNFRWERVRAKQCAKGSYRVTTTPSGVKLRFCCPKGKWGRGKCAGGVKLQAKGYPKAAAGGKFSAVAYPLAGKIKKVSLRGRRGRGR